MKDTAVFNLSIEKFTGEYSSVSLLDWTCLQLRKRGIPVSYVNKFLGVHYVAHYELDGNDGTLLVGYNNRTGKNLSIVCVQSTLGVLGSFLSKEDSTRLEMLEIIRNILETSEEVYNLKWIDMIRERGLLS